MNIAVSRAIDKSTMKSTPSTLSGEIQVAIAYKYDHIEAVEISNSRPFLTTHLFTSKPIDRVLTLIPSLYYICGLGHQIAALRAFESALGITETAPTKKARDVLLFAEFLREQVFSWATNWALHHKSQLSHVVDWFNQCNAQLGWSLTLTDPLNNDVSISNSIPPKKHLEDTYEQLAVQLEKLIKPFVQPSIQNSQQQLSLGSMDLSESVSTLLKRCADYLLVQTSKPLNLNDPQQVKLLNDALNGDDSEKFCRQPTLGSIPAETGSFVRASNKNKSFNIKNRLCTLYREISTSSERFRALIEDRPQPRIKTEGSYGYCSVETARGSLLHRVKLNPYTRDVEHYQIVAPTEWNFHPHGGLKTMLEGVYLPREMVVPLAETLIKLLDPCVTWKLEVSYA